MLIARDPTHMVVRGGCDRNRLCRWVDANILAGGKNGWKALGEFFSDGGSAIQEYPMARGDLPVHRACNDIARRELGIAMNFQHEAPAGFIDQNCAFAAQRFRGKWRRVAANGDCRGVKLNELR